jgi:2-polyprenyl-6-methoxyphenol hydroxylase-like FAD-dependent oxidoreductase
VAIVGGGPCGLMLANELGRRGIPAVLVDRKPATAFNPQANATQARTMEHYRRLGFADEIRHLGLPVDFPTDIAYFTRYAGYELARFSLPSAHEAERKIHALSGSWSAAELPHRISQKFVEQVLRRHAEQLPGISVNYGWRMLDFQEQGDSIAVELECLQNGARRTVRADYLVGADGPHSRVREALGFRYTGETGVERDFMGGRMFAMYVRAPDLYRVVPHAPAWMNVCFNPERRAFMAAVDGRGEFAFHTQLKPGEAEQDIDESAARAMFQAAVGVPLDFEILSSGTWLAGHSLVADHFQRGRVFLGGDAVHLFTPTGGLGYNTAVEDAVNLGWKLASVLKGHAAPGLLDSYERERRPLAVRNTGYARGFADSLGLYRPQACIEADDETGRAARREAGDYFNRHARAEFNIPGVTFGGRYDDSPAIVGDGTPPPPDEANTYVATAIPGGRPPHLWMEDGRSLYDLFGFEWTLLCTRDAPDDAALAARRGGVDLKRIHVPQARALYQADYALIRPDQIVAWRGDCAEQAGQALDRILGAAADASAPAAARLS